MPKKRAAKTKFDREKEKEAAKTLIYQGQSAADTARVLGLNEATVRGWIHEGRWKLHIKAVEEIVNSRQQFPTVAERVAFDRALTGKETRNSHSRTALKVARFMEEQPAEIIFGAAANFKAHVEAAAKIAGDYEDSSANKFAVSLSLNSIVQGGGIKVVPPGVEVVEG